MNEIETRLAALEAHLATLLADNEQLRAQIAELRNAAATPAVPVGLPDTGTRQVATEHDSEPPTRPVSRRGMIAAVAGAAGGALLANATPAAATNGQPVLLGQANSATATTTVIANDPAPLRGTTTYGAGCGVNGWAISTSGTAAGVYGESNSNNGTGVIGIATHGTGGTVGVYGRADSPSGVGVYGRNPAITGNGYAIVASGRFKTTGRSYLGAPGTPPVDGDLGIGSISFYLDQTNHKLKIRVKYSSGTLKTATVALA